MSAKGVVFNIQRFSIHDGPGIRTSLFLKGCPMRCFWCHNPEGRRPLPEIRYFPERCIACGACVEACPNHAHRLQDGVHIFSREKCLVSGGCVETCYSGALELNGQMMTTDEILVEVRRDRPFYESSGGGVTLSGGEPALHSAFAREILDRCKQEGLHTAFETCGDVPWESLESLMPVTDLVMMDIKMISPEIHERTTGRSNDRILENARHFALTAKPLIFRTPVVPTVNDNVEEFGKISAFIADLIRLRGGNGAPPIHFELLPFHRMAAGKYESLGIDFAASTIDPPPQSKLQELVTIAQNHGINARLR